MATSQKLLLTWMIRRAIPDDPETLEYQPGRRFYDAAVSDRSRRCCIAAVASREKLNPARIINRFEDAEEQREVAALFNTQI